MPKPDRGGNQNGIVISGNKRDNILIGTDAAETLDGKAGDDILTGGGGDDIILGGEGTDTAVYSHDRDAYQITLLDDGQIEVAGPEGTDLVSDVEIFQFADMVQTAAEAVVPRLANLAAGDISVDDVLLSPGEGAAVTVTIASNGTVDAEASTLALVVATAPEETAILGSFAETDLAGLATGSEQTVSLTLAPGTLEPGTYWVAVRVDAGDAVAEENEADNLTDWVQIVVEPEVADLRLVSATVGEGSDLDLEGGARIEIAYVIENASNIGVSWFSAATYLSTDTTISEDDLRISGMTGGTYPGLTTSSTLPHWLPEDFAPGDYYLISVVEWGDGTEDATPDNNVVIHTVTLTPPPPPIVDVAVVSVTLGEGSDLDLGPDGYSWDPVGAHLDLSVELANLGTGMAAGTGLTAYLSVDGTLSVDDLAIWSGTADIDAGSFLTINATADVTADTPAGTYHIIVVAAAEADIDSGNDSAGADVSLYGGISSGTEEADIWTGGPGGDIVDLRGGDDIAILGAGNDRVDGGLGIDTLDFSAAGEGIGVFVDGSDGFSLVSFPLATEYPFSTWTNFERLLMGEYDDQVAIHGSTVRELELGAGNDCAEGSFGNDVIDGGTGDDIISGLFGDDILFTGTGNDQVGVQRDTSGGVATGFGHDVVEDFDVDFDSVLIRVGYGESYDPLADLSQTAEGALLSYAEGSDLLLRGVSVSDLTGDHFRIEPDWGTVVF